MEPELLTIIADQSAAGAFRSSIHRGALAEADWNGFTTAHTLRALHDLPACAPLTQARERALGFLARCEAPDRPGAFGFWPRAAWPAWAAAVPADADDTAVIAVELARHGRIDKATLRRIACTLLVPHRLDRVVPPAPPWLRRGAFLTWLHQRARPNIVDCCVNANVVALMAFAGVTHLPGYAEAIALIAAGISWAGDSPPRQRALIPFYAHPAELLIAVAHAVECGADALRPAYTSMRQHWPAIAAAASCPPPDQPLWSNAYGKVIWCSPALQAARRLRHAIVQEELVWM